MVKSRTRVLFSWSRIWGNLIMLPFIESSLFFSILVSRNPYTVTCTSQEKWYYKTRTKVFRNLTKRNEIKKKKKKRKIWINKKNTWKLNWLSFINYKLPTKIKNKKYICVGVKLSYLTFYSNQYYQRIKRWNFCVPSSMLQHLNTKTRLMSNALMN